MSGDARVATRRLSKPRLNRLIRSDDIVITGRLARSVEFVDDTRPRRLLDIGCRAGWLERATDVPLIVGIDLAWPAAAAGPSRPVAQASALGLPFPDRSFDMVVMFEVLEHLPAGTESEGLAEIARVLRPAGTVVLSTPNRDPAGTALDPAWWLQGHRHYRQEDVLAHVRRAGLVVQHAEITGGRSEALYLPVFYVFRRLRLRIPFEQAWMRRIDREYRRPGRQTHFVVATRPAG